VAQQLRCVQQSPRIPSEDGRMCKGSVDAERLRFRPPRGQVIMTGGGSAALAAACNSTPTTTSSMHSPSQVPLRR